MNLKDAKVQKIKLLWHVSSIYFFSDGFNYHYINILDLCYKRNNINTDKRDGFNFVFKITC